MDESDRSATAEELVAKYLPTLESRLPDDPDLLKLLKGKVADQRLAVLNKEQPPLSRIAACVRILRGDRAAAAASKTKKAAAKTDKAIAKSRRVDLDALLATPAEPTAEAE